MSHSAQLIKYDSFNEWKYDGGFGAKLFVELVLKISKVFNCGFGGIDNFNGGETCNKWCKNNQWKIDRILKTKFRDSIKLGQSEFLEKYVADVECGDLIELEHIVKIEARFLQVCFICKAQSKSVSRAI